MLGFPSNAVHGHEVSILIAIGRGDGWCLGVWPRLKTSMMRIRPPQQGQRVSASSSASAVLTVSVEWSGSCIPNSLRTVAKCSGLADPAKSP
jgi:hypothetical protein